MNQRALVEEVVMGGRFVPPQDAQSLRELAMWMLQNSLDAQSEEAITVILKNGRSFEGFFIERCCEEYLLITRYLDDGNLAIPDEKAHKGFVALDWNAIAALSWTTAKVRVEPHSGRPVSLGPV